MRTGSRRLEIQPDAMAAFLLRFSLGVLFLFTALNKFLAPIGFLGVSQKLLDGFKNTYLPTWVVLSYVNVLPFVELSLGAVLLLGLFTREALTGCGLLLISLSFGKVVEQDYQTAAHNFNYVLIGALALWFSSRDNSYSLDGILGRNNKSKTTPGGSGHASTPHSADD